MSMESQRLQTQGRFSVCMRVYSVCVWGGGGGGEAAQDHGYGQVWMLVWECGIVCSFNL